MSRRLNIETTVFRQTFSTKIAFSSTRVLLSLVICIAIFHLFLKLRYRNIIAYRTN